MKWSIEQMWVKPAVGGYNDVVITAAWRCTGTEGDVSASVYSTASFKEPEGTFIPFDSLTEAQVLEWVWTNGVDKAAAEAAVAQQIQDKINPPITTPPLPWNVV